MKTCFWKCMFLLVLCSLVVTACGGSALPLRSDMPLDGLTSGVTYTRTGPAGSVAETNQSKLRGVNYNSPILAQDTIFGRMEEVKTEDVLINGVPVLGMLKIEREYGYSNNFTIEVGYFEGHDAIGNVYCGAKIRHQFNRNITQYVQKKYTDYDALWVYDVPCTLGVNGKYDLHLDAAQLRVLIVNEVWQARIFWEPIFYNRGHSVSLVGGLPAVMSQGWWLHTDIPNSTADAAGATNLLLNLIRDLATSANPWLDFDAASPFASTTAIYSAGDADTYLTWQRLLLNRQQEYVVAYRPDAYTAWDWITVVPVYNVEWNDAAQVVSNVRGWGKNPFKGRLNEEGLPKSADDSVIAEIEKFGCMNCPNPTLEQIMFKNPDNEIIYAITLRAYYGANQTLVIYGPVQPDFKTLWSFAPNSGPLPPRPILYDEKGNELSLDQQTYKTDDQWAEFYREATIWNWLKDNPSALSAHQFTQFNVTDDTTWAPIPCSDGGVCGYTPIEWKLNASYFFSGNTKEAWLVNNLLGEIGMRTLGLSFASNRFQGSGLHFAQGQQVFNDEYYSGFTSPEYIFLLDDRAMQMPDYLALAWATIHGK